MTSENVSVSFFIAMTKIPEKNSLQGERILFGSQSQSFQLMVSCLYCFGPEVGLNIMVGRHSRAKLLISWQLGKEVAGERARDKK